MPLKVTTRPDTGTLWITGTVRPAGVPRGLRIRQRAGTNDPRLAREEASALEASILRNTWHGKRATVVTLGQAAESYLLHEPRSAQTNYRLGRLLREFGDMPLSEINQERMDKARRSMLRPNASPAGVVTSLFQPMAAVLNHAAERGWCDAPRFRPPRIPRSRIRFLMPAEVLALEAAAAPNIRSLIRFGVCTGCRTSEMLRLEWRDVDVKGRRAILWEGQTKTGNRRVVELNDGALGVLADLPRAAPRVFLNRFGKPYQPHVYDSAAGNIKYGFQGAIQRAGLEKHTPHVLRHTWASWYYAVHRDLLALRNAGGWASTIMVERYAHVMPSGHEEEIRAIWGGEQRGV